MSRPPFTEARRQRGFGSFVGTAVRTLAVATLGTAILGCAGKGDGDQTGADAEVAREWLIEVDSPEHDLGLLEPGRSMEHRFPVRNRSDATVRLSAGRPSCGCLGVEILPAGGIPPGGEGSVKLVLQSTSESDAGHLEGKVIVSAARVLSADKENDVEEESQVFSLVGFVEGLSLAYQPYVVRMSTLARDPAPPLEFSVVTREAATTVEVLGVHCSVDSVRARLEEAKWGGVRQAPTWVTRSLTIPVSVNSGLGPGKGQWQVKYRVGKSERSFKFPLTVLGSDGEPKANNSPGKPADRGEAAP